MHSRSFLSPIFFLLLTPSTPLPPPHSSSCAQISFTSWSWSVSSFTFRSFTSASISSRQPDEEGYISFTLFHPAIEDQNHQMSCSAYSTTGFDGEDWYECRRAMVDADPDPDWGSFGARFMWGWKDGEGRLTLGERWVCVMEGDGDDGGFGGEGDRIYFNATGSATVKLDCNGTRRRDGEGKEGETDLAGVNCQSLDFRVQPSEIRATS